MKIGINIKKILYIIIFFGLSIYTYSQAGLENYIFKSVKNSYIFLILLAFISILLLIEKKYLKFFIDKSELLFLSMLVVVLFNNNGNLQRNFYTYELQFLCMFIIYFTLNKNKDWQEYFVKAFFIIGMIFSITTVITYLSPDFYFSKVYTLFPPSARPGLLYTYNNGNMPGLTYHYSTNGIFMSLMVLLSAYIINKKKNFVTISIMIFNLVALFLTGKRAHIIFTVIALLVSYYRKNKESSLRFLKIILIIFVSTIAFIFAAELIPDLANFINRFNQLSSAGDLTLGRGTRINEAIRLFNENKIIGIGWDQFKYWHELVFGEYINVHNIYIQIICENGLLLSIPFFSWMAINFYKSFKISKIDEPICGLLFTFNIFFLLYGFTGNPFYDAQLFIPYILICASINIYYKKYFKNKINIS